MVLANLLGGTLDRQLPAFNEIRGYVECETPNAATNKFSGTLHIEGKESVALSMTNVLLRGSSLRNTEYVLGLVINTGRDTKAPAAATPLVPPAHGPWHAWRRQRGGTDRHRPPCAGHAGRA